jgi:hypothetical protein
VTSQKAQIQALIHEINEALSKTSPRLPWVMSNDAAQQRQVLEQTRGYLLSLLQQSEEELLAVGMPTSGPAPVAGASASESAQQVLQAVLQEMNYWRVNMLQPLRAEIDMLQRQREILTQELRQLEAQRHRYELQPQNQQMLREFLQSAMTQMQANLSAQMAQMMTAQSSTQLAALSPAERSAQMQQMQSQSDQLMLKLDSTLQVIFESLNRNVHSYEESLEQGLNRMHELGQQGEAMFTFLVNRFAQQLGRETSSFLQSQSGVDEQPMQVAPSQSSSSAAFVVTDFLRTAELSAVPPSEPFNLSEEVLDIAELDSASGLEPSPDSSSNQLDALSQELNQLDLTALPTEPRPIRSNVSELFAGDQPLMPNQSHPPTPAAARRSDLDSALDLLNQLSAEMQTVQAANLMNQTIPAIPDLPSASPSSADGELIADPDSLYDDFDSPGLQPEQARPEPANPSASSQPTEPIDSQTLEQEWFGGLGDPAAQLPAQKQTAPTASVAGSVAQSLEAFLLSNIAPAASSELFAGLGEPSVASSPEASISAISASDLVSFSGPADSAAPLPSSVVDRKLDSELNLDIDMLEQLGAALAPVSEANKDWNKVGDASAALLAEPLKISEPEPLTIEGLEGLFADLPGVVDASSDSAPAEASVTDWLTHKATLSDSGSSADASKKNSERKLS